MNIECEKEKMIFRKDYEGQPSYSIGLNKKDKEGNWVKGYMTCRFPQKANIQDKTKIKIHEAWLDFYVKEKKTYPYIFINKYEFVEETYPTNQTGKEITQNDIPQNMRTEYKDLDSDVTLTDEDLPF